MNTAAMPSAAEVLEMRRFLARVVRTPLRAIKVTGNPETDENTDLLLSHTETSMEKLCPLRACEIDGIVVADPARGAALFDAFLAERRPLYP